MFNHISLLNNHLNVYQQILKGLFSFVETKRSFLRMSLDQLHEKNNKIIKERGGATSLLNTQDQSTFNCFRARRFMIKMLLAVQPSIIRITKNLDRNSTGMLNVFIKQFHVIPLK